MKFHTLINKDTAEGISETFSLERQITLMAYGLEDTDYVSINMVQLTRFQPAPCVCPPGNVVMPDVLGEWPLTCCGTEVRLTMDQPFAILDAPLGVRFRVKLENGGTPISTQLVGYYETDTHNVNDRLRGCPCGDNA